MQPMFHKDGFKKIGEGIYVYNNFVTDDECNNIVSIAESFSENEWFVRFNTSDEGHKISKESIKPILLVKQRLSNRLEPGIFLSDSGNIIRMKKNAIWELHSDNHDFLEIRGKSEQYKEEMNLL